MDPILSSLTVVAFEELARKVLSDTFDKGAKLFQDAVSAELNIEAHQSNTFRKYSSIKTILNPDTPIDLLSHYVKTTFTCAGQTIDDYSLLEELPRRKNVVIVGTGGGGKTIFMRYAWIAMHCHPQSNRIPIYIELRNAFDGLEKDVFKTLVFRTLAPGGNDSAFKVFEQAVADGKFVFVLDGFDEIREKQRDQFQKEILELAMSTDNLFLVSGRPDERFSSWQEFNTFRVNPLEKSQVVDLITKLEVNPSSKKLKDKFISRIKKDLYDKHHTLLSTPLLATMMFITFEYFSEIPEKMHLFYSGAFDALFFKHDRMKENFERSRYLPKMSIDRVKKHFGAFCILSYHLQTIEFDKATVLSLLKKAKELSKEDVDPELFLGDLIESFCMLQQDGLSITFSHRSFQEYFTAYELSLLPESQAGRFIDHFSERVFDTVIPMLFDMDRAKVEQVYVTKKIEIIQDILKKFTKDFTIRQYITLMDNSIRIYWSSSGEQITRLIQKNDLFLFYARQFYPNLFPKLKPKASKAKAPFSEVAKKLALRPDTQILVAKINGGRLILEDANIGRPTNEKDQEAFWAWLEDLNWSSYLRHELANTRKLCKESAEWRKSSDKLLDEILKLT